MEIMRRNARKEENGLIFKKEAKIVDSDARN